MYTIKEASIRSGVGVPLLRAWERRYGVVQPTRTPSGYRLYDEDAIARLVAMRRLIEEGWGPQQAAARVRVSSQLELADIASQPAEAEEAVSTVPSDRADELVERLVRAARDMDDVSLEQALDDTLATLRFEAAWESVIGPALHRIGDAWEKGTLSVAAEHAASETIRRRLSMAFEAAGSPDSDRPILVGLPPGARHDLGALAFAIAARRAGLPVLYLGADVPIDSWRTAAAERDARVIAIAVPRRADAGRARDVIEALADARRAASIVLVGGAGADAAASDGSTVAGSIREGVEAARRQRADVASRTETLNT